MDKSLKAIQVSARIGQILSKIVFICCIVGICGCAVGIITMAIVGSDHFVIAGVDIYVYAAEKADMKVSDICCAMIIGLVFCAAEMLISKKGELYFAHELEAGNPFTTAGADELLKLSIYCLVVPIIAAIGAAIAVAVCAAYFGEIYKPDFSGFWSLGLGLGLMFLSVVFRYGASLRKPEARAEQIPQD